MKRRTLATVREEKATPPSDLVLYGLVGLVSVACYVNGFRGDFVHDDIPAITMNKDVLAQNPLSHVFKNDFWGTPMADVNSHKSYRPLTTLTFRANYLLFGLKPFWFHVTNGLLHAAACLLFTRVCLSIARLQRAFAAVAGLLFAVHPIHTEAVTGIVGRADVLACVFFLISLLVYHGPESGTHYVGLSVLLGGLSMLAKETGITVFVLNLAFDLYRCWPCVKRTVVEVRWNDGAAQFSRRAAKVILSLGLLLSIRLALLQGSLPKFSQQDNPTAFHPSLYVRLLTFCYLAAFNWWLMLCPVTLSHDWQMGSVPLVTTVSDSRNLLTCVAFGAAILLAYKGLTDLEQQRHVPVVLGVLLLVLPFLPAANLFVTVGFVVAERVLYIPSVGGVLVVVCGAQAIWWRGGGARATVATGICLLLVCGAVRTVQRNHDWLSRESLLRAGLSALPHNAKMHYNFANFLRDSNQPDLAISHYNEALRLWPSYASAHNNLGTLVVGTSKAEQHFLAAIRYSKDHVNAHYNLGKLYRVDNRTNESLRMLERCITLDPKFILAYLELVNLKSEIMKGPLLRKVISLEPNNWEHYVRYAQWLESNSLHHQSLRVYLSALDISVRYSSQIRGDIVSLRGACLILRSFGQRSRILQLITRWHVGQRWGGAVHYARDVYLRQWMLRQELSTRANFYSPQLRSHHGGLEASRGRTCLDHSILDQSSVPRNINEYPVKPHIIPPADIISRFDLSNGDGISAQNTHIDVDFSKITMNLPFLRKQTSVFKTNDILIKEIIDQDISSILYNITNNVTYKKIKITNGNYFHYCHNSSQDSNILIADNQNSLLTININRSVSSEREFSAVIKYNKSDLHKTVPKNGRCIYAVRLGNILKECRRVRRKSSSKKNKNLKNTNINLHGGNTITPWLVQHFVDAL